MIGSIVRSTADEWSKQLSEKSKLASWLEGQLRLERKRILMDLEERHVQIVAELDQRIQRPCTRGDSPEPPRMGALSRAGTATRVRVPDGAIRTAQSRGGSVSPRRASPRRASPSPPPEPAEEPRVVTPRATTPSTGRRAQTPTSPGASKAQPRLAALMNPKEEAKMLPALPGPRSQSPPELPPQSGLNEEVVLTDETKMSLPGQVRDDADDDGSTGTETQVTPMQTHRSGSRAGSFRATLGRKSIAEVKDSQDDARKSVKAQKDARLRGMSQDQLYARRSGVTSSSPTVSQGTRRYQQDNFFVKRNRIETKTWIGRLHPAVLVNSPHFETVFCIMIVLNMCVMSFEVQYQGLETGYRVGHRHYDAAAATLWPGASDIFRISEWFFGLVFAIEILIRAVGWGPWQFGHFFWNWFDAGMVALWILSETWFQSLDDWVIRLARTARLFRLLRVIRMINGFDSLYLMMTAMRGSVAVLFWSFVLLLVAQIMIAFLLNQVLTATYLLDDSNPVADRQLVFNYFGTCSRAILSMFELTLGNWPVIARILQDQVSEWYFLFSIAHKVTIGFAVIGVINGVFMQETFKVAGSDDKIMMRQRQREKKLHTKKMKALFEHADESGDGILDMEEFIQVLENQDVRTWLAAQDLSINSNEAAANLFRLLDDGDAALTAQELVEGVARLKGPAKSMDLAVFKLDFLKFKEDVAKVAEMVEGLSGETVGEGGFASRHTTQKRRSVLKE